MKKGPFDASNKHLLIPRYMRSEIEAGNPPLYVLTAPDYDRVPIDTFLIGSQLGTMGRMLNIVARVVAPREPHKYLLSKLTPGKRLLYVCWMRSNNAGSGCAVKMLKDPRRDSYRHVVFPGEEGHDMIAAFKIACDTLRAWKGSRAEMKPTLLYRALKLDRFDSQVEPFDLTVV